MKILFVKITAALVAMLSPLSGTAESVTDDPCGYYLNKKPSSDYKLCTMAVERKVDFPELKFAYQLATADYAVKFCRGVELTEQERQMKTGALITAVKNIRLFFELFLNRVFQSDTDAPWF